MQDSCEIPTVVPTFSMFEESRKLLSILCVRGQKSKMAAHKDGELNCNTHVLKLINSMKLFPILCDASSERKISRWWLHEQEILISQPVYNVDNFNEAISYSVWCNQKLEILDGSSQTKNTYISTSIQRYCLIPTAILTFLRLRNFVELFPILCNASEDQQTKMAAQKRKYMCCSMYTI